MKRLSTRAVLLLMTVAVLGGTAASAAADDDYSVCVINLDRSNPGDQQGLCLVVSDPTER